MAILTEFEQKSYLPYQKNRTCSTATSPIPDSDFSEIIRQITKLIKRETNLGVQEMNVFFEDGSYVLTGWCRTFYTKQLAQQAAMKIIGTEQLNNRIRVI